MTYNFKFQKILDLKEREKDEAFSKYQESVQKFEVYAEKLFELLKKKEDLEKLQLQQISTGLSVMEIRHNQSFLLNLQKTIDHYQRLVINARNTMNFREEQLKESNIEMKKYEKMKEKSYKYYLKMVDKIENIRLDEFASQQYFHRGER
ncbi:flagellar export protein FliJ [Lederbergia graminis]|uniref:Flagellar FliJ protein n=1 Tax=Lederbergia graminis TaxID=735518 RepID=A0ABW0LEL2_9BACI